MKKRQPGETLPELTVSVIDELKAKGLNQSEIAEMFGVTRQAVSWHKQTYNGKRTPREIALQNFPWEVSSHHTRNSVYRRMRDHGEYMATGGTGMSFDSLRRLRGFYRKLRDEKLVVEFDPDLPAVPGFALYGGFALRKRRKSDGDLIIRVNEHTNLTDEGRMIWVLPPTDP
jgi:hypothetical protein